MKEIKFTTIKDEELKQKSINIILNVAFQEEDQLNQLSIIKNNIRELEEVSKLLQMGEVTIDEFNIAKSENKLLSHQLTEITKQLKHQKELKQITLQQLDDQIEFIEELKSNYKISSTGYVTFNEEYFRSRMNIYYIAGFTSEITKDDVEAGRLRGSKVSEWAKHLYK